MCDKVIELIDGLTEEERDKVLAYLQKNKKHYILLSTGYSHRINSDEHLTAMYDAMDDDPSFDILAVGGYVGDEPRFDCKYDDTTNSFVEDPIGRKIWEGKGKKYWDGVLYRSSQSDIYYLLNTIKDFDHCACLDSPYEVGTVNIPDVGSVTVYYFDTESG